MYKIFTLILITSITYATSNNKEFVNKNFPNDKCLNFSANYICIESKNKTNKLSKLIQNMKKINFFNKNDVHISKEKLNTYFLEKLKISEEKLENSKPFIYNRHQFYGTKNLIPIENKELSKEFNQALFQKEKIPTLKKLYNPGFETTLQPILGLIRKNSFIIRINNYDNISIYFHKDLYNLYFKRVKFEKLELIEYPSVKPEKKVSINMNYQHLIRNTSLHTPPPPPPPPIVNDTTDYSKYIKYLTNIIIFLNSNNNRKLTDSGVELLNTNISNLLTQFIQDTLYDGAYPLKEPFGEGELYLYKRVYQLLIDFIDLTKQEQTVFLKKLIASDTQTNSFEKEIKLIKAFYKKHPIKVFVTQTKEYHSPFTDGVYGYLYIHHSDIPKIQNPHMRKYLFMHEKEHILQHFVSPKNRMKNSVKQIKMRNFIKQVDILLNIINTYDDYQYIGNKMFQEEIRELKSKKSYFKTKIQEDMRLAKKRFLASLEEVDFQKILSPYEEINIDVSNIKKLNTKEQYQYYIMLKRFNKEKENLRLNSIQKYVKLSKVENKSLSQSDLSLIKTINNLYIQASTNGQKNTNSFLLEYAEEIYTDINRLKNSKTRVPRKIILKSSAELLCSMGGCAKVRIYNSEQPLEPIKAPLPLSRTEPVYKVLNQLYNMDELQNRLEYLINYILLKNSYEENYSKYIHSSYQTGAL